MRAQRLLIVTAGLLAAAMAGCAGGSAPPAPATSAESSAPRRPDISGTWVHPGGPGGATTRPAEGIPLTPWAIEKMKSEKPTFSNDFRETTDPAVLYADPNGYPRIQMHPMKFKLVQTDDYVYHLWEYNQNWRQIAINKEHSPDDPPTWYGNAVGKWDGDTLVVESIGFKDGLWLDISGTPLTDAAKVTERFRRPTFGKLEIEVTVDDPKAYTKPWSITVNQTIALDTDMLEFVCQENEKDVPHLVGK